MVGAWHGTWDQLMRWDSIILFICDSFGDSLDYIGNQNPHYFKGKCLVLMNFKWVMNLRSGGKDMKIVA